MPTSVTALVGTLYATLTLSLIAAYAWRQVRTGQWSWLNRSTKHAGAVRVTGGCGLIFCALGLIAVWWTTLTQLR